MSYIPEQKVEEIRAASQILPLVEETIHLKKSGISHTGVCPWCDSKSFSVTPSKNIFKCFKCGKGGDPVKYLMYKGKTFPEALKILADKFNVSL